MQWNSIKLLVCIAKYSFNMWVGKYLTGDKLYKKKYREELLGDMRNGGREGERTEFGEGRDTLVILVYFNMQAPCFLSRYKATKYTCSNVEL